jgi:PAT family beta-lactamase induction signal transducer AmpG
MTLLGVRSTFYRFAMITGQGLLIILAGFIESHSGLESVEITVRAQAQANISHLVHPDSLQVAYDSDEIKILTYPEKLEISTQLRSKSEVDSMVQFAYHWNLANGFIQKESQAAAQEQMQSDQSWWQRTIVQPIEQFIRTHFGEEEKAVISDKVGNIGVIYFYLSKQPDADQKIVVNFGRSSGDKSIALIDSPPISSRLTFNISNWNKAAMALVQLDPKLRTASMANFTTQAGNIPLAWSVTFFVIAGLFICFFIYHKFMLPYPASERPSLVDKSKGLLKEFFETFILFFKKDKILLILGFLLLYRLAESQLVKLASPFLLDTQELGGLALTTGQVGFVYGTVGLLFLTFGGLLGGFVAAKKGLKFWLWPMAIAINLPDAVYIYLAYTLPDNFLIINLCVALEQFGYGFGFTAYMLYMIYVSEGKHKTAHFAITTAFMALGMMIPGMWSGWLQEMIGYKHFFIWILLATIPGFIILSFIPLDKDFGKKKE